jgi:hypothetical protein
VTLLIEQKTTSTKRGREASPDYLKDLKARLGRFAEQFKCPVTCIRPDDVLNFLDGLKMRARTRFNYARLLRTLFRFAQSRRFYPKEIDPMEGIEIDFDDNGEIEIFTAAELDRILKAARPELIPFVAIGAFAGLIPARLPIPPRGLRSPTYRNLNRKASRFQLRKRVVLDPARRSPS